MSLFKNYKCPNGLSPEECRHVPQLVINLSNYFKAKQELRKERERDGQTAQIEVSQQKTSSDGQRQRTRG